MNWLPIKTTDPQKIATNSYQQQIKVISFNILADCNGGYINKDRHKKRNETRGTRISDQILHELPDIACFQEVDSIQQKFDQAKLSETYSSVYYGRPCKEDGLQTFYNKYRFDLLTEEYIDYNKEALSVVEELEEVTERFLKNNICHLMLFYDKFCKKEIWVSNTHLFWNPKHEDVKYFQMAVHWNSISRKCHFYDYKKNQCNDKAYVIAMGDYNFQPGNNGVHIIYGEKPKLKRIKDPQSNLEVCFRNILKIYSMINFERLDMFSFENCYSFYNENSGKGNHNSGFPSFTNYRTKFKGTLDHIFYNDGQMLVELRDQPSHKDFNEEGIVNLPNKVFPSDHLPIGAIFAYNS